MADALPLTGNGEEDKRIVYNTIVENARKRFFDVQYRPIDDQTHYSFEILYTNPIKDTNGVILSSDDRRGNDIWLGITDKTYDFFNSGEDERKRFVIVVDSILKHVVYIPFLLLKGEWQSQNVKGYLQYRFHVLDPRARFTSYVTKKKKRSLAKYVDNMDTIFDSIRSILHRY